MHGVLLFFSHCLVVPINICCCNSINWSSDFPGGLNLCVFYLFNIILYLFFFLIFPNTNILFYYLMLISIYSNIVKTKNC